MGNYTFNKPKKKKKKSNFARDQMKKGEKRVRETSLTKSKLFDFQFPYDRTEEKTILQDRGNRFMTSVGGS